MNKQGSFYDDLDTTRAMKIELDDKGRGKSNKKNKNNNKNKNKNKNKKNKKSKATKIIVATVITLLVVAIGIGTYIYMFLGGFKSDDIPKAIEPAEGIVNVLIIGKDVGAVNNEADEGAKRTDTIMLLNFNTETKEANVVSIPRDTKVVENSTGEDVKINSLYQYGVDALQEEVEELLMVSVNYVVELDYNAFRGFIDAIGGVEVTPEYRMKYDDDGQNLHIDFEKGETVLLDGKGAEEFFRWRKNNDWVEGGMESGDDIARIGQQQKFMNEIVKKCISPEIVTKIPGIVDVMQKNITTNMSAKAMLKYAMEVRNISTEKINMVTLPGGFEEIKDTITDELLQSFWKTDPELNFDLICKLNPNKDKAELQKAFQKVIVLNGTGISGLAGDVQAKLNAAGYQNVETGNADDIYEYGMIQAIDQSTADNLSKESGISDKSLEVWPAYANYDAVIILGMDYEGKETASND